MRLIDADKLAERVTNLEAVALEQVAKLEPSEEHEKWKVWSAILNERTAFKFDLFDAPTVDPIKHGRWTSSQGLAEAGEVQCSNCKTIYYAEDLYNVGETDENGIGQALMPNYCPHCGSKNDEVEDG